MIFEPEPSALAPYALTPLGVSPVDPVEIVTGAVASMTPPLVARSPIESSVMVVTVSRLVPFSVTIEPVPVATTPGAMAPFVVTVPPPLRVTCPPLSAWTPAAATVTVVSSLSIVATPPFVTIVTGPPSVIVDGVVDGDGVVPEA